MFELVTPDRVSRGRTEYYEELQEILERERTRLHRNSGDYELLDLYLDDNRLVSFRVTSSRIERIMP